MIEFPRKRHHIVIGIDPDKEKSGIGILDIGTRKLELQSMSFPVLLDYLQDMKKSMTADNRNFIVIVEAGWMNKSNWHLMLHDSKSQAARKGYDVGRNHETGHKIVEVCKFLGIRVVEHIPLVKRWQGKDGKITHEELAYFTGITKRTNQDERDAILLAWHYAALPIRIKVRKPGL
jgi:hypothetical protein